MAISYTVEEVKSRRSRKGRVQYFVKWSGYPDSDNTWETRMDLIRDGHHKAIQAFEKQRKSSKSSGDESDSRSVSRSSRSRSRSRSSVRASRSSRSKSTSKSVTTSRSSRSSSRKSTKASKASTPKSSSKSTRSTNRSKSKDLDKTTTSSVSPTKAKSKPLRSPNPTPTSTGDTSDVDHLITKLRARGWLARSSWIVLTFLLLSVHALLPALELEPVAASVVSSTTALVPLVLLLFTVTLKSSSSLTKSVEVALCWRTAGELILKLKQFDTSFTSVYSSGAYGALAFSNCCCLYGLSRLSLKDPLVQALGVLGVLGTFASDAILLVEGFEDARVTCTGLSLLFLTLANVLQVDQDRES